VISDPYYKLNFKVFSRSGNYSIARWQRGKTAQFPDLEIELVIWITDHRMQGYAISTAELRLKATHLARCHNPLSRV
jgi:hypothetical protein